MADNSNLRDLSVSIDFKEVDINRLIRLDKQIDDVDREIKDLGTGVRKIGREFGDMGRDGSRAFGNIDNSARDASHGTNRFLDTLGEVIPQGRASGLASTLFSNPWLIAGATVAAAIGGVSLALGKISNESDAAFDRIDAMTSLTGQDLRDLQQTAENVYEDGLGESLESVGVDVANLRNQFKNLDNVTFERLAKGVLTIEELFGEDSGMIGGAVKTMTANFKELSETDAMDLMTYAFQNGGNYANDLLDTLREYSPYFAKLGMDAEDFVSVLLAGGDAGAWNLDRVADAVKEFGIRSIDGSDPVVEAFEALGFSSDEMSAKIAAGGDSAQEAFVATTAALSYLNDEARRNQLGVALFGTQWEDVREDVIFSMNEAQGAVLDFRGVTEEATEAMTDNFESKWNQVTRQVRDAFSDAAGGEDGGVGTGFLDGILEKMPEIEIAIDRVVQDFKVFGEGLWNLFGPTLEDLGDLVWDTLDIVSEVFGLMGEILIGDWGAVGESLKEITGDVIAWISEFLLGYDLGVAGADLVNGLIEGFKNETTYAVNEIKKFATTVDEAFRSFFGINSPSTLMEEAGGFIIDGLDVGISNNAQKAIRSIEELSRDMVSPINDLKDEGKTAKELSGEMAAPILGSSPGMESGPFSSGQIGGFTAGMPGGMSINAPINVTVQINGEGTPTDQAVEAGQTVGEQIEYYLSGLFTQLQIKLPQPEVT